MGTGPKTADRVLSVGAGNYHLLKMTVDESVVVVFAIGQQNSNAGSLENSRYGNRRPVETGGLGIGKIKSSRVLNLGVIGRNQDRTSGNCPAQVRRDENSRSKDDIK